MFLFSEAVIPHDFFWSSVQKTVVDLKVHKWSRSWYSTGSTSAHVFNALPLPWGALKAHTSQHFTYFSTTEKGPWFGHLCREASSCFRKTCSGSPGWSLKHRFKLNQVVMRTLLSKIASGLYCQNITERKYFKGLITSKNNQDHHCTSAFAWTVSAFSIRI